MRPGLGLLAVLDTSNATNIDSAATFLHNARINARIQLLIEDQHIMAHRKVMVHDSAQ